MTEANMKSASGAILVCGLLLSVCQARAGPGPTIQPTPLEAFAGLPTTHVEWSSESGHLDSAEAHLAITAPVLQDTAQPPDRMRGIRIDLRCRDRKDQIYLGEETLPAYIDALADITRFANLPAARINRGGTQLLGTRVFWYGDKVPRVHVLTAADYVSPHSAGLIIWTFRPAAFRFPHENASQLSAIFEKAMDQLKRQ
jgi:hypothetical protein